MLASLPKPTKDSIDINYSGKKRHFLQVFTNKWQLKHRLEDAEADGTRVDEDGITQDIQDAVSMVCSDLHFTAHLDHRRYAITAINPVTWPETVDSLLVIHTTQKSH